MSALVGRTAPARGGALRPLGTAPLVVATHCPSCGGSLELAEGSNAVRCGFCSANLLVTGRGQVLSFLVPPQVSGGDALSAARFAASATGAALRRAEPQLCFVPYYRFVADEYRWQERAARLAPEEMARTDDGVSVQVLELLRRDRFAASATSATVARIAARHSHPEVEFVGRRVERSFLACEAPELACASLGVRPGVLTLELLHADAIPAGALVLAATQSADDALARAGAALGDDGLLERALVSRLLSLVHFPLWAVRLERDDGASLSMVDGVTGSVVAADVSPDALASSATAPAAGAATLGFRPLLCPNCGSDLPLEPRDVVFACGACAHAWLIEGQELKRVSSGVAAAPRGVAPSDLDYRPVWVLDAEAVAAAPARSGRAPLSREAGAASTAAPAPRLFAPAFRAQSLKLVKDLGARLSERNPELVLLDGASPGLCGCVLDEADARAVAAFVAAGARHGRSQRQAPLALRSDGAARLVWLAIVRQSYGWREPLTGMAIPPEIACDAAAGD